MAKKLVLGATSPQGNLALARAYLPKQKLGEIVPFLEDALKYEFEPGWKRLLGALGEVFTVLLGRDWEKWEKLTGTKSSDWSS